MATKSISKAGSSKPAAKAPSKPRKAPEGAKTFAMPQEVKDWIERAQSIMSHQKGEIERLKKENAELRDRKSTRLNSSH